MNYKLPIFATIADGYRFLGTQFTGWFQLAILPLVIWIGLNVAIANGWLAGGNLGAGSETPTFAYMLLNAPFILAYAVITASLLMYAVALHRLVLGTNGRSGPLAWLAWRARHWRYIGQGVVIVAIIGQAFSGGAIGVTVGDRILMLEHAVYSVIVPESCSTILFRTRDRKEEAAEALKLSADDLLAEKIIDRIVPEPFGGAHRDFDEATATLKRHIQEALGELRGLPPVELVDQRVEKFGRMGVFEE